MRLPLIRLICSVCICLSSSIAFAKTRYQVVQLPDEVPAQYLTRDGRVLGLDWATGTAVLWSVESGITTIVAPDGNKWYKVAVSPGGRFLGTAVKPDYTDVFYEGQLGSTLAPISWPTALPGLGSAASTSAGGIAAGSITICAGPCPPDLIISPPPYIPQPPRYSANAINDDGTIAGVVFIDKSSANVIRLGETHAIRFHPNGQIDVMQNAGLTAVRINSRGDTLVAPTFVFGFGGSVTLWTAESQLFSPDQLPGYANVIGPLLNDPGEVAGTASNQNYLLSTVNDPVPSTGQGFLWSAANGTIALDLLPGFASGVVHGLNNAGSTVGVATNSACCLIVISDPASTVAVLWQRDGHVVDLNTLVDKKHRHHASGMASLTSAFAINDAGQILAFGVDASGKSHVYFLLPRHERESPANASKRIKDKFKGIKRTRFD